MATPHVSAVIALMLEKNPDLTQEEIEGIIKSTALPIPPGSMDVFDYGPSGWTWYTKTWDEAATGSGLIQANAAFEAVP